MIKVVHVISSLKRGGRERQLALIVANTDQTRYNSKIVYFNRSDHSYIDEYNLSGVSIEVRARGKGARLFELNRILHSEAPDIVFSWGNGESISILILKLFHRFVFINGSIRHGIRSFRFSHYLRTCILYFSKFVVANSKAGLKANNLRKGLVLQNGIESKFLEPCKEKETYRLNLTGLSTQVPLLISVGNLVPYKDYFSVLCALKNVKNKGFDFHYYVLGAGPQRLMLEKKVAQLGLKDRIEMIGNVENVTDYLRVSDIFIHSSKGEGCSNAILEAMAAGLPVIATKTGGTPEIVQKGNGILFDYKNVQALTDGLLYLLNNRNIANKMGETSRDIIRESFTLERMMVNYYNILNGAYAQREI